MKEEYPIGELSIHSRMVHETFYSSSDVSDYDISKLRELINNCGTEVHDESILYQGSQALLKEIEEAFQESSKFRKREIELIEKLHRLTDDPSVLIGYEEEVLRERKNILEKLNQRLNLIKNPPTSEL